MVVRAKKLRTGEEEKLLTVLVMGEEGSIGEGVLGIVQVNVRPLIDGTVIRASSPTVERTPSPEPFTSNDAGDAEVKTAERGECHGEDGGGGLGRGGAGAGIVTEIEGWYRVMNTHKGKDVMESARLHLRVKLRVGRDPAALEDGDGDVTMESARESERPETADLHLDEPEQNQDQDGALPAPQAGGRAEKRRGGKCQVM